MLQRQNHTVEDCTRKSIQYNKSIWVRKPIWEKFCKSIETFQLPHYIFCHNIYFLLKYIMELPGRLLLGLIEFVFLPS